MVENQEKEISKVVCIGDLHGNLKETLIIWNNLIKHFGSKEELDKATVVFLGDYFDHGPSAKGIIDFLINLKEERSKLKDCGKVYFLAGNHDFGFGAFIGALPNCEFLTDEQLDSTVNTKGKAGNVYPISQTKGIQHQGRKWGQFEEKRLPVYADYIKDPIPQEKKGHVTAEAHLQLKNAVPENHKQFIRDLDWIVDVKVPFGPGRVICTHAGLADGTMEELEIQIKALKDRNIFNKVLYKDQRDPEKISGMMSREVVIPMPEALIGKTYLVSGHHGIYSEVGDRIIIDLSAGDPTPEKPMQAIVLPERAIVTSNE